TRPCPSRGAIRAAIAASIFSFGGTCQLAGSGSGARGSSGGGPPGASASGNDAPPWLQKPRQPFVPSSHCPAYEPESEGTAIVSRSPSSETSPRGMPKLL